MPTSTSRSDQCSNRTETSVAHARAKVHTSGWIRARQAHEGVSFFHTCYPGYMRSIRSPPPIVHRLTMGRPVHHQRQRETRIETQTETEAELTMDYPNELRNRPLFKHVAALPAAGKRELRGFLLSPHLASPRVAAPAPNFATPRVEG